MADYNGVLSDLLKGTWLNPDTGKPVTIDINDIVIDANLDGREAELVSRQHAGQKLSIVSDPNTHAALGSRVFKALQANGFDVSEYVWETPKCSDEGVEHIRHVTRNCEARIAVGSGTISDTVKYASFLDKRKYSVFATSPMNAYSSSTASVLFDGFKRSIACAGPQGIFFDMRVVANCPSNLISAAFADVICRTTSQVDWLLSHLLLNTVYTDTPFALLRYDEPDMLANANIMLSGDINAVAMLTRISVIMGIGSQFTGTTHSGSMAEHMISHYIDMFAGNKHPQSSHGEQVGVSTITMSQIHNQILNSSEPPILRPTVIPVRWMKENFSKDTAENMIQQTSIKALDSTRATELNMRLEKDWDSIRHQLARYMLPHQTLRDAMQAAGCPLSARDLNLDEEFYKEAVTRARYIRDRFSMLDIVDDSIGLETFISTMPV